MSGTESGLERKFLNTWMQYYPQRKPITQVQFHPVRLWRFDFAWPDIKLALEVQGQGKGHQSLKGMNSDYDKNMQATILGWRIVYCTTTHLAPDNIEELCHNIARILDIYDPEKEFTYVPLRRRKKYD